MGSRPGVRYFWLSKWYTISRIGLFRGVYIAAAIKGRFMQGTREVMIRALYELGYIHYKTMLEPNAGLDMTGI